MSIISKINNLIKKANETTKKQDADLTSAIGSLIDGFGGGGSENVTRVTFDSKNRTVHIPRLNGCRSFMIYREDYAEIVTPDKAAVGTILGALLFIDGMSVRVSGSLSTTTGMFRIYSANGYFGFLPNVVDGQVQILEDEFIVDTGSATYAFDAGVPCIVREW